jgi:N-acetylglucosamine transport system permease protein
VEGILLGKESLWGLVLLQSRESRTLAVALNGLQESLAFSADWVGMFAAVVIVMNPALVVYVLLSQLVLGAVTLGAVKESIDRE